MGLQFGIGSREDPLHHPEIKKGGHDVNMTDFNFDFRWNRILRNREMITDEESKRNACQSQTCAWTQKIYRKMTS